MLDCEAIEVAMSGFRVCEPTTSGFRISTHCLYPSFEPVDVFVVSHGDNIIVHDGGGAARSSWSHGAEKSAISRSLRSSANSFGCEVSAQQIRIRAQDSAWLFAAVTSVANASSDAARAAVGRLRMSKEESLIRRTKSLLDSARWKPETQLDFTYHGKSGKIHTFDLSVKHDGSLALIDAVVPHPNSIAAKYLAFSDTETRLGLFKYALYDVELAQEDKALLSNVADLISFSAISGTNGHFLLQ